VASARPEVSSVKTCGREVQVQGGVVGSARLAADGYELLADLQKAVADLRSFDIRIDLFTFM